MNCILSSLSLTACISHPKAPNIFKADISHPELVQITHAFENICLPFIAHETQLSRKQDQKFYHQYLGDMNFKLVESRQNTVLIDPIVPMNPDKTYTVFDGTSPPAIVHPTREYGGPGMVSTVKTGLSEQDLFQEQSNPNLAASLNWNPYQSQKRPASSCQIKLYTSEVSTQDIMDAVIKKDSDWTNDSSFDSTFSKWSQCAQDDGDDFLFTISRTHQQVSLKVVRNNAEANKVFTKQHNCLTPAL